MPGEENLEGTSDAAAVDASFWTKLKEVFQSALGEQQTVKADMAPEVADALKVALEALKPVADKMPPDLKTLFDKLETALEENKGPGRPPKPEGAAADAGAGPADMPGGPPAGLGKTAVIPPEITAQLESLAKQNTTLAAQLAIVEKQAQTDRDIREKDLLIAKAGTFNGLPVKTDELADQLHFLAKSDPNRAAWWSSVLTATQQQLKDAGLFVEKGTTQTPEPSTVDTEVTKAEAAGTSARDALLAMPVDVALQYVQARRAAVR